MRRAIAVGVASCRYGGGAASKGGDPWFGPVLLPQIHEPRSAKIMGHNIYIALHSSVLLSLLITFIWFLFLLLLLLVLLLVSSTLGVQIFAAVVQYISSKQWGSFNSRLLALGDLLAFQSFERLFNQSNVASQGSFELVHSCFVFFEIVDVMASKMVCGPANSEQVGQSHEESGRTE